MKRIRVVAVAALVAASLCPVAEAFAAPSCTPINRQNLIRCALEGSLTAKAERQSLEAADARQEAARPVLPANPIVTLSGARRSAPGVAPVINWYATLSQEIEIGGQRDARQRAASAEREAQAKAVTKTERDVAAAAWRAYFEALAGREEVRLGEALESLTAKVAMATRAAADKGVVSGVDADVAETAHLRVAQERIAAARRAQIAKSALVVSLGLDPSANVDIEGTLLPLADVETYAANQERQAPIDRPEVQALEATGRAYEARASVFRRSRVPNPTIGVFVQNDGFNEQVFGAQISVPIPLPQPVGRTYAGEIAEAEALSRRAKTEVEQARREIKRDLAHALATFAAARAQSELYTATRLERADQSLRAIASEIEAGRLAIRDAIVSQQALVEMLRAGLETKKNLALASVDLAVAAGYPLERGAP
ncbi:MAG: TolC family protein [Polyangiaceae bacterium]|nr:TolC family protein [Polyangiaceae bacterium]